MSEPDQNQGTVERLGAWAVIVPSILVLAGGLAASYGFSADLFSRSGALLIAILLLLFGLDRRKSGGLEREIRGEIEDALDEMGMNSIEEYPLAGTFTTQYLPVIGRADRFISAELMAGAIATLIWGFGDLLVNFLFICGEMSC